MWNEIKVALRGLAKTPGFVTIAIVTLALAIGATTAVFSLINALIVRPLPYHDPGKLVLLWEQFVLQGLERIPVSAPEYVDLEKDVHSFSHIAAFDYRTFNLGGGEMPERISGAVVSPALFPLLGVEPVVGRTFAQEEQGEGHDDVIVISERLWKRRFNSDRTLVGKPLLLNGRNYTVIGIMPERFEFPIPLFNIQGGQFADRVDVWKPIAFTALELKERYARSYGVIARLRVGISRQQAQAELDTVIANWLKVHPDNYRGSGFGAKIYALQEQVVGGMRKGLGILLGAVAGVLLIACANIATMLLARATARERELAIRVALGAARWRLVRQLLTESVLLALGGAIAGVLLSIWGIDLLVRIGARTVPRLQEVDVDLTVLLVTAVVSVGTGILFGLVPALATAKPELTEALKEGGRGSSASSRRNRVRNSLVVAEMALALVLLIGAGLLMKSYARLQSVNPGFNPRNVLTLQVALSNTTKYPPRTSPEFNKGAIMIRFWDEALRRIKQLPGVEAAAATTILPLSGTNSDSSFMIEGRTSQPNEPGPDEEIRQITPDYFRVLQTPLLRGRVFTEADNADAPPVTIVNEALAKKYWGDVDPIGKRITFDDPRKDPKWVTVVGVMASVRHRGLDVDPQPEYYLPIAQRSQREVNLAVRSTQDPRTLAAAIRREIQSIDPDQPISNVQTLEQVAAESLGPRRMSVVLLAVFAGIALLLASVGTYGVIAYLVVQRTHEIGVRMALGAQRADVLRLVVGHAGKLVLIGTAIGLLLAFVSTRALSAMLYSVGAFDMSIFALVTIVLAVVALVASYIPAVRATRADPMVALSHNA